MCEAVAGFRSLPPEYQRVLELAQETHSVEIKALQRLTGGRSGALLYLVSALRRGGEGLDHLVLKLDESRRRDGAGETEADRHRAAMERSPAGFVQNHMAALAFDPVESEGRIAILYRIAGDSVQRCRPVASYVAQGRLEKIFRAVSGGLLNDWNAEVRFERAVDPRDLLVRWLGHRITPGQSNLEVFFERACDLDPATPGLIVLGEILPNPLVYARHGDRWAGTRPLDVAVGLMHGDLNVNNVLVDYARPLDRLRAYYLIDFGHFEEATYLFYDHLYFETSYLLRQIRRVPARTWAQLVGAVAKDSLLELQRVPSELAGPWAVVLAGRRAFDKWVRDCHPTLYDDLWGQFSLAAVAAGMNFCNKETLPAQERLAALAYAAAHLGAYCERFDVSIPSQAKQLCLRDEEAEVEPGGEWEPFLQASQGFAGERLYFLVVGPQRQEAPSPLSGIGRVGWSLVLDFDQDTQTQGLYGVAAEEIEARRALHLVTSEDDLVINPIRATYWYAARGLTGRAATLPGDGSWLQWNRKYSRPVEEFLLQLVRASQELPVTVVVVWDEQEYVQKICELIDQTYGDNREFIFATPGVEALAQVADRYSAQTFSLRLDLIASGLRTFVGGVTVGQDVLLPSSDGVVAVGPSDANWLEEELTLVHTNLGADEEDQSEPGRDFLRGNKISWFELGLHVDIPRDKAGIVKNRVESDLESRDSTRINVYHYPGAGGTTVAMRVAWDLHAQYPTVLVRGASAETVSRFRLISQRTAKPILAVVESVDVSPSVLERLYSQVRTENLAVVFLVVSRRFKSVKEGARTNYLRKVLDPTEAKRFARAYGQEVPERRDRLNELVRNEQLVELRTPFYFGLLAFREDFVGLESYVRVRLEDTTDIQRRMLCYLALAHFYAQKALPAQFFRSMLGTPGSRVPVLDRVLEARHMDLLVKGQDGCRPAHMLIAEQMIQQILAGRTGDQRVWKQSLSAWAIHLIEYCAGLPGVAATQISDFVAELMTGLFVTRDTEDVLSTPKERPDFARLIEDIGTPDGQLAVLQSLVTCFPQEAHFWAHFARILSYRGQHDRALDGADKAIALDPSDDVLHHMKGMVLRQRVYAVMRDAERRLSRQMSVDASMLEDIDTLRGEAESEFTTARSLGPDAEHPYISHIQLLVRTVEFGFCISGQARYSDFLTNPQFIEYQDMVEKAESLLDEARRLGAERAPSRYIQTCESDLTEFYEDYSLILQRWNNLLDRGDIYAPPVRRRLAYAYLAGNDRSWDKLDSGELARVCQLMEDNVLDEPGNNLNIRLWFQAARRIPTVSIDRAIEQLTYWRAGSASVDSVYYLYGVETLRAIAGSQTARRQAERLIDECRQQARPRRNRNFAFEWFGHGTGMTCLVHYATLGTFDREKGFYKNDALLVRLPGKVARIDRPESGLVELECGLKAFFVPQRRGPGATIFHRGRDENKDVDFFLGFSYDGLKAWSVGFL